VGNSVSILRGVGNGSFLARTSITAGGTPSGLAVGDLDGDGKPDLLVPNRATASVSVLMGGGPKREFLVGNSPVAVTLGDYDGDGKLDAAVVNSFANTVTVLLGTGNGLFNTPRHDFSVGELPQSIVAADLNSDGRLDLAVANTDENTVSVLMNTGGLSWVGVRPPAPLPLPATLKVLAARPNPAHDRSEVRFVLPDARRVRVDVIDVTGRIVRTLQASATLPAGEHAVRWDGRDTDGAHAAAGLYVVQVRAGGEVQVAKLLLVR